MELIVFEKEAYYKMLAEMKSSIREAIKEAKQEMKTIKQDDEWIGPLEAQSILKCKKDKLQQLRENESMILTSRFGRKIAYHKPSLLAFMHSKAQKY